MVSWLGFGIASTVTKTFMHFLPAAAGIGAPYPVDLKVTVGGSSLPRRTLSVDGARLGHPDGFRLEDAIPAITQRVSGIYLLQIDLVPTQQRIDLSASALILELQYQQGAVRYLPRRVRSEENSSKLLKSSSETQGTLGSIMSRGVFNANAANSTGFALKDSSLFASVVILNSSPDPIVARIFSSRVDEAVASLTVAADSVKECDLLDLGLDHASKLDCSWGSVEVEAFRVLFEPSGPEVFDVGNQNVPQAFSVEHTFGAAVAAYVVYREKNSRRISSVVAL